MLKINEIDNLFADEPLTEREAWRWLINNIAIEPCYKVLNKNLYIVNKGQILTSNRSLAKVWQWNEVRVRRFLSRLKCLGLIDSEVSAKGTVLTIDSSYISGEINKVANSTTDSEVTNTQRKDSSPVLQEKPVFTNHILVAMTQSKGWVKKKDEKEKNQKKKKKEKKPLKEKNIPLGNTKKEKVSYEFEVIEEGNVPLAEVENAKPTKGKDAKPRKKPKQLNDWLEELRVDQVEDWARENMLDELDLTWELEKFKDYFRAYRSKPPRDGVAALRNWLRNSIEFNRNMRKGYGKNTITKPNARDLFTTASANILAKLNGVQLDRDKEPMGHTLQQADTCHLKDLRHLRTVS
ncbi:hypothetical protein [Candidatus Jidaibacter acanthamoebae]|nr:hypothetical protein [Candidatus Jidaibacter acanthamoeba]